MDDRETVAQNRRLLAEAITGDAATPLVALARFIPTWWFLPTPALSSPGKPTA